MEENRINILDILSNFVNYKYITECQAGYITGMINCHEDGPVVVDKDRIFEQLILFINNQIDKEN